MVAEGEAGGVTEERTCRRCGAILGAGNEDYCNATCLEMERRGIKYGSESRLRQHLELLSEGPIRAYVGTAAIR